MCVVYLLANKICMESIKIDARNRHGVIKRLSTRRLSELNYGITFTADRYFDIRDFARFKLIMHSRLTSRNVMIVIMHLYLLLFVSAWSSQHHMTSCMSMERLASQQWSCRYWLLRVHQTNSSLVTRGGIFQAHLSFQYRSMSFN